MTRSVTSLSHGNKPCRQIDGAIHYSLFHSVQRAQTRPLCLLYQPWLRLPALHRSCTVPFRSCSRRDAAKSHNPGRQLLPRTRVPPASHNHDTPPERKGRQLFPPPTQHYKQAYINCCRASGYQRPASGLSILKKMSKLTRTASGSMAALTSAIMVMRPTFYFMSAHSDS